MRRPAGLPKVGLRRRLVAGGPQQRQDRDVGPTGEFLSDAELGIALEHAGALGAHRVITYCGGGIAASHVAFALRLLGHEHVSVYDASLEEWATDPSLPMEVG